MAQVWASASFEVDARIVAPIPVPSPASGEGWRTAGTEMVLAA
jgi:hypothetical protein